MVSIEIALTCCYCWLCHLLTLPTFESDASAINRLLSLPNRRVGLPLWLPASGAVSDLQIFRLSSPLTHVVINTTTATANWVQYNNGLARELGTWVWWATMTTGSAWLGLVWLGVVLTAQQMATPRSRTEANTTSIACLLNCHYLSLTHSLLALRIFASLFRMVGAPEIESKFSAAKQIQSITTKYITIYISNN